MIRTFAHRTVIDLARAATVPVINGLTDMNHPCQSLADYMTIFEKKGKFQGLKIAYIGDGNNMAHSLMMGACKLGMDIAIAAPEGYQPEEGIVKQCLENASQSGAKLTVTADPKEAAANADVIYTDVWASMGLEAEQAAREKAFRLYQVNAEIALAPKKDYLFMHCLPAHRGEEVSEDVIDGKHSIIFDQAENRLHAQKSDNGRHHVVTDSEQG